MKLLPHHRCSYHRVWVAQTSNGPSLYTRSCGTEGLQQPLVSRENLFIESYLFVHAPAREGLSQNPGGCGHPSSTAPAKTHPCLSQHLLSISQSSTGGLLGEIQQTQEMRWNELIVTNFHIMVTVSTMIAHQQSHHLFSKSPLWSILESLPSTLNFNSFCP